VLSYVNEQDFVAINSEFDHDPVADYDRGIFLPGFGWPSYFKMQLNQGTSELGLSPHA